MTSLGSQRSHVWRGTIMSECMLVTRLWLCPQNSITCIRLRCCLHSIHKYIMIFYCCEWSVGLMIVQNILPLLCFAPLIYLSVFSPPLFCLLWCFCTLWWLRIKSIIISDDIAMWCKSPKMCLDILEDWASLASIALYCCLLYVFHGQLFRLVVSNRCWISYMLIWILWGLLLHFLIM